MAIDKLIVDNSEVLISREIQQAPIKTMVRELLQNAIEAQSEYKNQLREIKFSIEPVELEDGSYVDKLSLKNNGTGMTSLELRSITNLSASIGKSMGKGANYGIGAKVSGLRSNPAGIIYHSNCSGIVSEVTIMCEDGVYGRYKDFDSNDDVFDVTGEYQPSELVEDWTKVTLLGADIEDNTMKKPFGDEIDVDHNWLNSLIHYRYFRFPNNIGITYGEGVLSDKQTERTLYSWEHLINVKDKIQSETVDAGDGVKVIYALNNNGTTWNAYQHSLNATGAIVYKDEMFDVASSHKLLPRKWGTTAPRLGIPFGSDRLSIFIELDDGYPVDMNQYRDQLVDNLGDPITLDQFAQYVSILMPDWVKSFIDDERKKHTGSNENMRRRIESMIRNLSLKSSQLKLDASGKTKVDISDGTGGLAGQKSKKSGKKRRVQLKRGSSKSATNKSAYDSIPQAVFISDKDEIREKGLTGKAASFVEGCNTVFINAEHPAYLDKVTETENDFAVVMADESGRVIVMDSLNEEYEFSLISSVIHSKYEAKRGKWDTETLNQSLSNAALTVAASKDQSIVPMIKMKLGSNKELQSIKAAA